MDYETAQILGDADEIEFTFGSQYPPGSRERAMLAYCASILRREFGVSDAEKLDLVLKTLSRCGPCPKDSLLERLDFSREECRRIVDLGISSGTIEVVKERTNGRSRSLLRIP